MLDYSKKVSYGPVEPGEYELNIELAEFGQTDSGINYITLTFRVREDVEQPEQGSTFKDTIWENQVFVNKANNKTLSRDRYEKLPANQKGNYYSDMQYADYKIRPLIQAQDNDPELTDANGNTKPNPEYKTSFENMDEVVFFLNGLNIKAEVGVTTDSSGKEKNTIDYKKVSRTDFSNDLPF